MGRDVFLSYSRKDTVPADTVCEAMENEGISVWMAPRDIVPGATWAGSIMGAISTSRVMVLLLSKHANASPQVGREVERAANRSIPIIPVRIENVAPSDTLEYFISSSHWLDAFTPPLEPHLKSPTVAVKWVLEEQRKKAEKGSFTVEEEPARTEQKAPKERTEERRRLAAELEGQRRDAEEGEERGGQDGVEAAPTSYGPKSLNDVSPMRVSASSHSKPRWLVSVIVGTVIAGAAGGFLLFSVSNKQSDSIRLGSANRGEGAGNIKDEAMRVGRAAESLAGADEDYFRDMDYGVTKHPLELARALGPFVPGITPDQALNAAVMGRNNWMVWTAGNDRLWDVLNKKSFGELDFLKTLSSHPSLGKFSRDNRWNYLGLVNEPCFSKATGPRRDRFGLWLDVRDPTCPADPYENEQKYPGVKIGARGRSANFPIGSYYGYATGIVGLRLFPNPDFDEKAERRWDAERFYSDPSYYNDPNVVRPYRVGMSCGFCHVGPNPTNPPADPENPKWENLNSNPGAQYFRVDRIFSFNADSSDFYFQYLHSARPGALDTSLVSTDYIMNPRTMNAIYNLGPRLHQSLKLGHERLSRGEKDNRQFNEYVPAGTPLTKFFQAPDQVWSPRLLKDGSDSVGALGSFNRAYIEIGMFSEEWFEHFNPIVGGKPMSAIPIETGRENSSYWRANEAQTPNTVLFFLATARPDYLKNAPGGEKYLTADAATLKRGKEVFGERCLRCHSSKLPEKTATFFPNSDCDGKGYLACWNNYWEWTKTEEFKLQAKKITTAEDFLADNSLSTDLRVPVTLLETNACSPLASNALKDNIWSDFSSSTYKDLPSVGMITVHDPYTGEPRPYVMPANGRGYTRPASLVTLWSTAPFLLNNEIGEFNSSPSVEARMASFASSIEQMLWPEKRPGDIEYITASGKRLHGRVLRTTATSYLKVPRRYLPEILKLAAVPHLFDEDGVALGPIPKGMPVALIGNIDLDTRDNPIEDELHKSKLLSLTLKLKLILKDLPLNTSENEALEALRNVYADLLEVNKCPDFVVNRGHYFGTDYFREEPGLSERLIPLTQVRLYVVAGFRWRSDFFAG